MQRITEEKLVVVGDTTKFGRVVHRLFLAFAIIHAVLVCVQPIFAGISLDGNEIGLFLHGWNALVIWGVVLILLVLSILWWRPGRGPGWAPIFTAIIFAAVIFQPFAAVWGLFSVHLPLGVGIAAASLALVGLLLRRSARTTRTVRLREAA